jgi:hypothetical protein
VLLATAVVASMLVLSAAPAVAKPKTQDLCKGGGWATLVDDNGDPFSDQKDCSVFAKSGGTPAPPPPPLPECTVTGTDGDSARQFVEAGEVYCALGGVDIVDQIELGGVFIGGEGNDSANYVYGTFYGGSGDDHANNLGEAGQTIGSPLFDGGPGSDSLTDAWYGTIVSVETVTNDNR